MQYVRLETLVKALKSAGLEKGDTCLIHNDISKFAPFDTYSKKEILDMFYNAIMECIGESGTICVPAFFYEYASKNIPFDISLSPISKGLGSFSNYIFSLPNTRRSANPLTSIVAIGKNARYLCEAVNRNGYGENSTFDKLYKMNAKILLLGTYIATINHLAEYQVGITYRYNKLFNIPILDNGKVIFENSVGYVRYLDYDITYKCRTGADFSKYEWLHQPFTNRVDYLGSYIFSVHVKDQIDFIKEKLYIDPYYRLEYAPRYINDKIPLI